MKVMILHTLVMAICVEEAIQEALRDGRFHNLPGQGKPLQLDPSPDAVINNLLKEAHVRPEWIEVACQIDALQTRIERHLAQYAERHEQSWALLNSSSGEKSDFAPRMALWRRWWHILWHGSENRVSSGLRGGDSLAKFNRSWSVALARYAEMLHQSNALIRRFNRLVPQRELQRNLLPVREKLEEFARRFAQGALHLNQGIVPCRAAIPEHLLHEVNFHSAPPSLSRSLRQQNLLERTSQ